MTQLLKLPDPGEGSIFLPMLPQIGSCPEGRGSDPGAELGPVGPEWVEHCSSSRRAGTQGEGKS